MSYRPRRGRSRTPTRLRPEPPSLRTERSIEALKRPREREEPKRERWEGERTRPRGRSPRRLNQRRSNSLEKRGRFDPPEFTQPKRNRSNERSKYIEYPSLNQSWSRNDERLSKFSPPTRYSPSRFPEFSNEGTVNLNSNHRWSSNDIQNTENFPDVSYTPAVFPENENVVATTIIQPPPVVISDEDFRTTEPKKEEQSTIPEFNPETSKLNSQEWIKLIETTAEERDWKPDEKLYVLTSRLAGYARQWHLNTGIKCKNWADLKQAFFTAFPSENDYYQLLKKMMARTKEERESLTSYFHHKVALLNACDIYGRKAVSCIVGGLPNNSLKEDCKWQNFDDPDLLYQFLRSYSESSPETSKRKAVDDKKASGKKVTTNQVCFYCKKKGHLVVNCELKLKHISSQPYPEVSKPRNSSNNLPLMNLSHKPTYNKYFTEVVINGIPVKGYIDQGSECTTIREENAHFLKLSFTKQYKMVKGFGGQAVSVIGVADIPICVDRAMANVKLYVVSNHSQAIPVIVGQSFTEQPHVVVMKDGDKVRFYQRMDTGQANFDF